MCAVGEGPNFTSTGIEKGRPGIIWCTFLSFLAACFDFLFSWALLHNFILIRLLKALFRCFFKPKFDRLCGGKEVVGTLITLVTFGSV